MTLREIALLEDVETVFSGILKAIRDCKNQQNLIS
jgi:hypothetical protein